ncbi:MAG TPA: PadR family transcriptional regulator [Galbitalea sp.]
MPTNALSNPLVLPILGLLAEQPRHAYGIFNELRSRYVYAGVRNATVYTLLNTLVESGLLRTRAGTSHQREFMLTASGRRGLAERVSRELQDGDLVDRGAFLTALAYVGILTPESASLTLQARADRLRLEETRLRRTIDETAELPELHMIETHFYLDQIVLERTWLEAAIGRIQSGELPWPAK